MLDRIISASEDRLTAITRMLSEVALLVIVIMILITVADVFARRILNATLLGAHEIQQFCYMIAAFLSMGYVTILKRHVTITFVSDLLPKGLIKYVSVVIWLIIMAAYILLGWRLLAQGVHMMQVGVATPELYLPEWPFLFFSGLIGFAGMVAALAFTFLQAVREVTKK